ncbi:hypothetical protein WOLCODRAFT_155175 [Wolfiporia cocos MD-104 SS10]|uniref:CRAL-TRIO domain-containing protein n=1 Tax=Wolfiporia cocos (strain MD-104) TaxID=742152 RepID=A0A2H3IXR6_WOLCO|nr:hypothetical protein WOLCODRAFT_155175 [Wolfiporia cocos MD-104 SS10]
MYKFFIINASHVYIYLIWSFVKLWLAKETLAKIDILGADYQAVLLKDIDRENLPAVLGGTFHGSCPDYNAGK